MALLSDLKVGEIYDARGRRARLDSISKDPSGDPVLEVSVGRRFERRLRIASSPYQADSFPGLGELWTVAKERREADRASRDRSDALSGRISDSLSVLGLQGGWISRDGSFKVYGDLPEMERLAALLEDALRQSSSSALSDLF